MIEDRLGRSCRRGSTRRNRFLTKEIMSHNQEKWEKRVGYGRRSVVESSFSRYKRTFGEGLFSRKQDNMEKEIITRVNILNRYVT